MVCKKNVGRDCNFIFWDYTVQLRHSQRTHTHTPMNTRTQILPLWVSSKTEPANPRDWRSHHRRLAVDENIAYHLMHNIVKFQKNPLPWGVEPKISNTTETLIITKLQPFHPSFTYLVALNAFTWTCYLLNLSPKQIGRGPCSSAL